MSILRIIAYIVCLAVLSTLMGCAKFPTTAPITGKQLVLTMRVRGKINPIDDADPSVRRHYFVAIDNENDPNVGPWAVLYPPWANGWATSADAVHSTGLTSYVQYDATNPQGYIYGVLPGSFFLNTTSPQPPIRTELLDGGSTVRFTVDFGQIGTTNIPSDQIRQLNINFITTNALPVNPTDLVFGRQWDGLGPSGQDYVNVDTTQDRVYSGDNASGPPVADPDLDIIYWSVEVQTVSSR